MPAIAISDNILSIGAQDAERKLFDCLMPTPHGTSYNSYLIIGSEKTALIDTVDPDFSEVLLRKLQNLEIKTLDYVVILHTEQDHAGSIHEILKVFPQVQLVGTANVVKLMQTHLHLGAERFMIKDEGDVLDLGDKSLTFHKIPFAHWPDNTMVFEKESRILFSSDLFGSHYASEKVFATASTEIRKAARSYYAEIMMPFAPQVRKYTEVASSLQPKLIASSHGPVWNDPAAIIKRYMKWTNPQVEKSVVIPYVSMHGSTAEMVERLSWRLAGKGISVLCRNLGEHPDSLAVETGHVMEDLVMAAAVVFATPTVLGGPHPAVAYCALVANALRPKTRIVGLMGSFGWGTKVDEVFSVLTSGMKKAKRLEPLLVEGLPTEEEYKKIDDYADALAEEIMALGEGLR